MKMLMRLSLFLSLGTSVALGSAFEPRQVGMFNVRKAAFLSLERFSANEPYVLSVSSFGLFGENALHIVDNVASALLPNAQPSVREISKDIVWPNEAKAVPSTILGRRGLLVSGGFLVPGNSTGAVTFVDIDTKEEFVLTSPKKGWFYHRSEWLDVNGDGLKDLVTARGMKSMMGGSGGELLWLENPGKLGEKAWKEHVIGAGPDVYFRLKDLDNDGFPEIVATQYFSKKLTVWWRDGAVWSSIVVDNSLGSAFDSEFVDLNGDGREELLVTNHEGRDGKVFAYIVPQNFISEKWERKTLVSGIETRQSGFNQASPGQAVSFFPHKDYRGKPYIVVAGDGSQRAHLVVPASDDPNDWTYNESTLWNAGCTVGQTAVGDVNDDGYADIFVPGYDAGKIAVFTFAP
jgi:hypothetical protein